MPTLGRKHMDGGGVLRGNVSQTRQGSTLCNLYLNHSRRSMLVYIFAMLRETSMLGHTDIPFEEIDVNSYQSIDTSDVGLFNPSSKLQMLDKTKSAGYVVRVVMDELEKKGGFSTIDEADMGVMAE